MGHMSSRTEHLLSELTALTGEDGEAALHEAVRERLERDRSARGAPLPANAPASTPDAATRRQRREALRRFQEEFAFAEEIQKWTQNIDKIYSFSSSAS